MRKNTGRRLLLGSAMAMAMMAVTPAYAAPTDGEAAADSTQAAQPATPVAADERLVPLSGGIIRPFGGGILPYFGNIRTFAGPISGSSGNIRSFEGDVAASSGNIRSFAGNIRAFSGNIRSFQSDVITATGPSADFWGKLYPASGSLTANSGNIRSFAGQFEAFSGNIRSFSGNIRSFDGSLLPFSDGADTYTALNGAIGALVAGSKSSWGAAVTAQTGKTFEAGFADRLLGKYGINLADPSSLVGLNELGYELFLMDWYDNLQLYSGADSVDHWMRAVHWTPRLTQDLGSGRDSKIGLLDFTVTGDGVSNIVKAGGVSQVAGIHGSAVLSLMTAAHDGRGVMGIAPGASVVTYNPFDASYTAGWADITAGVGNLVKNGATIINMSLGVPGWTLNSGWNSVFLDPVVGPDAKKRVFVLAAGNDGISQSQNVTWAFDKNPAIIVVGSVDPSGNISAFSNRPGTACLTQDGKVPLGGCNDDKHQTLASRFIVAPGEFILVDDGQGGVTRMSGTSFAAPLVSGTVALIHDRWPWLRDRPKDTAELILSSARDIGAPGIDPVYGRGELDVAAALSPASLAALSFKVSINGAAATDVKAATLTTDQRAAMITFWEANRAYVVGFDDTLTSYRDFAIPLSTKLAGQTYGSTQEQFNSYLTSRFLDWFRSGGTMTKGVALRDAFGPARFTSSLPVSGGLVTTMTAAPKAYRPGFRQDGVPFETGVQLASPDGGYALRFGSGRGGAALGSAGFAMQSDYDVASGGANPFLGFASGAGYAAVDVKVAHGLTVTTGVARQDAERDLRLMSAQQRAGAGSLQPYQATATTVTVKYSPTAWLRTSVGYTGLDEATGLLGTQSLDRNDFRGGTRSDAGTAAVDVEVTPTLAVSGVATWGRTRPGDVSRQAIAVSNGGVWSSSYQAAVTKVGLIGNDRLRFTVSQPLHLERGSIDVSNVQVIDRATGALGTVVQTFQLSGGERRYLGELLYGRSLMGGRADLNLFGRMNLQGQRRSGEAGLTMGGSFRLGL